MLTVAFAILFATAPLISFSAERVFFWLPPYLLPSWEPPVEPTQGLSSSHSWRRLIFDGLAFPIIEEVYFRGFLLPRMTHLGLFAPAANALLFAAWHLWQPYNWPLIFLLVLVNAYVVWWKRNIFIAMLLHCSANTIGATLSLDRLLVGVNVWARRRAPRRLPGFGHGGARAMERGAHTCAGPRRNER
jgi:membrane protease YdiL (CAAX protease family)